MRTSSFPRGLQGKGPVQPPPFPFSVPVFKEAWSDEAMCPGWDKSGFTPCVGKSAPRVGMAVAPPWVFSWKPDSLCDPQGASTLASRPPQADRDVVLSPHVGGGVSSLPSLSTAG